MYLIERCKCKKQSIGETEDPLHLRINGYRSDYYCQLTDKPVIEHFNTTGHSFDDMTVMVFEQIHVADTARQRQ